MSVDVVTRARAYLAADKSTRLNPNHPAVIIRDLLIEVLDRRGVTDHDLAAQEAEWDEALGIRRP